MLTDYKHSMSGWSQAITGVEFNCTAATQVARYIIHLNFTNAGANERRTSQPYGVYGIRTRFLWTPRRCVTHGPAPKTRFKML